MSKKVTIIGAGFSGLTAAYYLNQQGFDVHVYEKADHVGGLIQKKRSLYGNYETAANGIMGQAHILKFLDDLDITYQPSSSFAKKRFILRNRLRRWPLSIFETMHLVFKVIFNLIILRKHKKINYQKLSVASWISEFLTDKAKEYLIEPALKGIYAGNIESLSSQLIIQPMIIKKSPEFKTIIPLVSGQRSFHDILQQIYQKLLQKGVHFSFNTQNSADIINQSLLDGVPVIMATSASDACKLINQIKNHHPDLHEVFQFLNKIELVPITTVTMFFKQPPDPQYIGFGCLFPQVEGLKPLGVLMNDVIFDRHNPYHSETWIFGGAFDVQVSEISDSDFKKSILEARKKAFDSLEEPIDIQITRWRKALPHFTIQHEENVQEFKQHNLLKLHGNYLNVIGVSKIIVESQKLALQLKEQFTPGKLKN